VSRDSPEGWEEVYSGSCLEADVLEAVLEANGLKPVNHHVDDSEGPPDFWASEYTVEKIGPYPSPPFPTANERKY